VPEETADADWDVRATWASLHILGVLDTAADPALEAIVRMTARSTEAAVELKLRDGPTWRTASRVPELDDGAEQATSDDGDTEAGELRVPVTIGHHVVGELRGSADHRPQLELAADEVAHILDARWIAARRDELDRPVGVVVVDEQAVLRWLSPEVGELVAGEVSDWLGRSVLDLVAGADTEEAGPLVNDVLGSRGRTASVPITLALDPDDPQTFEVQGENRFEDPDVGGLAFVIRPPRDTDDEHTMLGHQMWVLNRLSAGRPLDEVLGRIVDLLEHGKVRGDACVMFVDAEGTALEPAVAPSLPADLLTALRGLRIGTDEPAGGAAVQFSMPQFTSDLRTARAWGDARDAMLANGYLACWSTPIISTRGERPLGSIDFYRREVGNPTDAQTRLMVMAVRLAALAIDHDAHEREMRHAATHDPLTALPNRTLFAETLDEAAADGNLGVLFVDLDRFKLVNDTLGHDFGDDLLRAVADRLADAVIAPAMVARFGGDEFTVLLPKVEELGAAVLEAERLLTIVSEPYRIRGQTVSIGASAGAAVAAGPDSDPSALVREADAALYHAKERGRGRVEAFDDRILAVASERVRVERTLRDALDAGLVDVMFQPSVLIADGSVVGVEALARCRTSTGEMIPPLTFIPVAEECGLIDRVFDAVLAESCRVAKLWNAQRATPMIVWVNLSPLQLGSIELLAQVDRAFAMSGVDPTTIGFEVTEQGILSDPEEAARRLGALVALGPHIALDDFGTGYSSLSHLQELPVDTVKLDRSFVIRAVEDRRSRAIVGGVVQLAEAMGLHCVAEGVETTAQLEAVRELGCDTVQGFVYSRPKRAADLAAWLATRT
jgi:diguanylate cyclase (GGDEF)-like protein